MKKPFLAFFAVLTFALSAGIVQAAAVPGTDLYFDGGQTGTYVYSSIYDTNTSNSQKWKVKAIVTVCGNVKTNGGFFNDSDYVSEPRSFWCNETASYDYQSRP